MKRPAILLIAILLLAGCKPRQPVEETSTPPPQVIHVSPDAREELALDGDATVVFDQPMDASTVTIDVHPHIDYTIAWADDTTLNIIPVGLTRATQYTFTVSGESKSGEPLAEAAQIKLVTVGALRVTDVVPANGATAIATDSLISVFFNRPVVPVTLLENLDDHPQPLHFEPDIPGKGEWVNTSIYIWRPDEALIGGQQYTVTLDALTSADGAVMPEPYSWTFITFPPEMISGSPWADAKNVRPDETVSISFNQPMDRDSVEEAFTLTHLGRLMPNGDPVPGSIPRKVEGRFEWDANSQEFVFTPRSPLAFESSYRAHLGSTARAAQGSANIATEHEWKFRTVRYPRVVAALPRHNSTDVSPYIYTVRIGYSAPLDPDSIIDKVKVEPKPLKEPVIYLSSLGDEILITTVFEGRTRYTISVDSGVSDPYGNVVESPYVFQFTTGDFPPEMVPSLDQTVSILDPRETSDLIIFSRNLTSLNYTIYEMDEKVLSRTNYAQELADIHLDSDAIVRKRHIDAAGEPNVGYNWRVRLNDESENPLPPGVYLMIARATKIQDPARRLIILANANVITKHTEEQAAAWVVDIQSGKPLPDVTVRFYRDNGDYLGSAVTDASGVAVNQFSRRYSGLEQIIAVAEGDGVYGVVYSGWGLASYQNIYRGELPYKLYAYTDRPIYRPGQTVNFKGILRYQEDATYSLPGIHTITATIQNPSGETVYEKNLTTSDFGSITDAFNIDVGAATGSYILYLTMQHGDQSVDERLRFQVAEYNAPAFEATLTPSKEAVAEGETIEATLNASYFFGGPVQQGWVKWRVFTNPHFFEADLDSGFYSFTDITSEHRRLSSYYDPIAEGEGPIEADGKMSFTIPTDLTDVPDSQLFTITATLMDTAGDYVTAQTEVVVHKGPYYVGVRPQHYLNTVNQPTALEFAVVDWDGNLIAGQNVQLEVFELKAYNVQEESPDGRTFWTTTTEEISVMNATVQTDAEGYATTSFIPTEGGSYKVIAHTEDGKNISSTYFWVSGDSRYIPWVQRNNNTLDLIVDKTDYAPGDTAHILITSPFVGQNVRALITVERSNLMHYEVVELTSNSYLYDLPITDAYAPNVYVSVTLIKGADVATPQPDYRFGEIRLGVDTQAYELNVSVTPNTDKAEPGDEVTYQIKVTDSHGSPVDAEVSLALVDLATLRLANSNSIPLIEFFYNHVPLKVWTSLSLVNLVEPLDEELLATAKGGGGGGGDAYYDLRTDFKDTAYWNAAIRTGESGTAEITVTLPDNLTTWRMDARAITANGLVGETTSDIVSTQKLIIRPSTPRFFVPSDEATLGALVINNTSEPLEAAVTMVGSGYELHTDIRQQVTIPANNSVTVEWPITISEDAEWVDLTFAVEAGTLFDRTKPAIGDPDHDRMLPVYRYIVPETIATAGQLTEEGTRTETLFLPPEYTIADGDIEIRIDHTLAGTMITGLEWLEVYPYFCTEQTVSRFLANAYTSRIVQQLGLEMPTMQTNLTRVIETSLQRLYYEQQVDGSWGWFPGSQSSSLVTAYVVQGMITVREAGHAVDEASLQLGIQFLHTQLGQNVNDNNRQAYVLYVLARAGYPDVGRESTLFDQRVGMKLWAKALLAQTLAIHDPADLRVESLKSDLVSSAAISAVGAHWAEDSEDYWNWNTSLRTTAIVLDTFAKLWPDSALATGAVRWLMANRTQNRWETTQETTWSLIALADWMQATNELNATYDWSVDLDAAPQMHGTVGLGNVLDSHTHTIPIEEAGPGSSAINFTHGPGEGNLYYSAYVTAYLPVEEVDAVSHGFVVTRRYLNETGEPVDHPVVGDTVTVELTVIVPEDQQYVLVEDYLPAGSEAVDTTLLTNSSFDRPNLTRDSSINNWGWWWFNRVDIRDEKVVLQAEWLPAGTYVFSYKLRLTVPGTFHVIPAVAQNFYFPEVYGRSDGEVFVVEP